MSRIAIRAAGFVALFAALQALWQCAADTPAGRQVIEQGLVAPAAGLIDVVTPQVHVRATGRTLLASGGGINVVNGCDGMESLFLLLAAFAVAPMAWRPRIVGALLGIPIVYLVNQARIVALFYGHRGQPSLFHLFHSLVAPILMVLVIVGYYLVCIDRSIRTPA
jgi:exosortase family protein XrtM